MIFFSKINFWTTLIWAEKFLWILDICSLVFLVQSLYSRLTRKLIFVGFRSLASLLEMSRMFIDRILHFAKFLEKENRSNQSSNWNCHVVALNLGNSLVMICVQKVIKWHFGQITKYQAQQFCKKKKSSPTDFFFNLRQKLYMS